MELQRFTADVVVTCDMDNSVFAPGVVDTADGKITWVGASQDAPPVDDAVSVADVGGLLMPGLVNAHCHTPMTLMRGSGDGLPLHRWLTEAMWPREGRMTPEDAWWGMTLGSAEMLLAGVTTSCEMYLFEEAMVDAVMESGARLVMTPGVVSGLHSSGSDRTEEVSNFFSKYHDPTGRITVGIGPHSAYDLGIAKVVEMAELAQSLDAILHLHLAETREENVELEATYGRSITAILHDNGVFDSRVLAAHCVWVDKADIALLAADNVAVAHCPISNMRLGCGIAPLTAMKKAGVIVGYGTDGPASNGSLDLWEEVKMAALLARVHALDSTVVSTVETLTMATRDSAAAVGLKDTGYLAPGTTLDMIRMDLGHTSFVPVTEPDELLAHVAWSGSTRRVTDVWVAGEKVVSDGEMLTVDMERVIAEVGKRALRLARG